MLKKLGIIFGVLVVVLAVACGGSDKGSNSDKVQNDSTPVATKKALSTKSAPTKEATADPSATDAANSGDSAGALESLSFLTGGMFGGEQPSAQTGDADPKLASMLIADTDLPTTFASVGGDVGFSTTMPQGEAKMAMRTFSEGDPNASQMTPTIISGAMLMPPAALDEFDSQLAELDNVTTDDIQEAMGGASMFGIEFKELSVDKISLGDGGIKMHMVMDMSAMVEGLGDLAPEGADFPTSLSFDIYVFKKGDVVLMAMTMLPPDSGTSVDIEDLAKIMESRAP
jgi:hypothetical protein